MSTRKHGINVQYLYDISVPHVIKQISYLTGLPCKQELMLKNNI